MTDLTISENDLQTYNEYIDSLEHHGILGQRWGRKNGPPYPLDANDHSAAEKKAGWRQSLEGAADKVKSAVQKHNEKVEAKKAEKAAQNEKKEQEAEEQRRAKAEADKQAIIESGDAEKIKSIANELTNQELQIAVNRMNLMRQVDMNIPTPQPVENKINSAIGKLDKAATTVSNGINAYNKIANIYNKFNDPPMPTLDGSLADRNRQKQQQEAEKAEKARKDLVEKAIRTGDPEKILMVRSMMTSKEVQDASARIINEGKLRDAANKNAEARAAELEKAQKAWAAGEYDRNVNRLNQEQLNRQMSNKEKDRAYDIFRGAADTFERRQQNTAKVLSEMAAEVDTKKRNEN